MRMCMQASAIFLLGGSCSVGVQFAGPVPVSARVFVQRFSVVLTCIRARCMQYAGIVASCVCRSDTLLLACGPADGIYPECHIAGACIPSILCLSVANVLGAPATLTTSQLIACGICHSDTERPTCHGGCNRPTGVRSIVHPLQLKAGLSHKCLKQLTLGTWPHSASGRQHACRGAAAWQSA